MFNKVVAAIYIFRVLFLSLLFFSTADGKCRFSHGLTVMAGSQLQLLKPFEKSNVEMRRIIGRHVASRQLRWSGEGGDPLRAAKSPDLLAVGLSGSRGSLSRPSDLLTAGQRHRARPIHSGSIAGHRGAGTGPWRETYRWDGRTTYYWRVD